MKRTYQPLKVVRANTVSVIVWQLKTVVACLLAVVVKDAKFWLHNPNEYKMKNQRKLETAGFLLDNNETNCIYHEILI